MSQDDDVERVARAICEATSGPFEMLDDVGRDALRHEARAAISALPPRLSPELIAQLNALASRLTAQGEYEAVDLIDTVVERVTAMPQRELLREALDALEIIGNHPTGGVGCNPQSFVEIARTAADKIRAALGGEKP